MAAHSSILTGESHGQRSLGGYGLGDPRVHTTERLNHHRREWSCNRCPLVPLPAPGAGLPSPWSERGDPSSKADTPVVLGDYFWELPGNSAVRTPWSHWQRPGFDSWSGNSDSTSHTVQLIERETDYSSVVNRESVNCRVMFDSDRIGRFRDDLQLCGGVLELETVWTHGDRYRYRQKYR